MSKTTNKAAQLRPQTRPLSNILTVLGVCALGACTPFTNDWTNHRSAPDASYQTTLLAGNSAQDLMSSTNFKSIVVEIGAVHGFAPTQESLNHLQTFLEARLDKPNGINIVIGEEIPPSPAGTTYSVTQIRALEDRYRDQLPKKDQLTVYYLFLDGASSDDNGASKILGQAHRNTSVAVFENTLRTESAKYPNLPPWLIETTVMEHEFGHLLGLVHNPITDVAHHEDPAHPNHCVHNTCLMYYAADSTALLASLGNQPPALDPDCLQDLKTAGGK